MREQRSQLAVSALASSQDGQAINKQLEDAKTKQGPGDLQALLSRGDTWTVN